MSVRQIAISLFTVLLLSCGRGYSAGDYIVWDAKNDRVSADMRGQALWPLLEEIARQTGWHIYVEPGASRKADVKFTGLSRGEALKKLLGNLNFAFVPQTSGPDSLYIFTTTMRAATQSVALKPAAKVSSAKHVANELLLKVKPGTDVDALVKSLGAKVIGRDDKLGIYRLQFEDAASTDSALVKLKDNSEVAQFEYNYLFEPPVLPQKIDHAPMGPVSLTLNPPPDSGRVIVGLVDTAVQPLENDLDKFLLKSVSVVGDSAAAGAGPTHATSMAETILRAMAAQGGSTSAQILPVDVYGPDAFASTWNVALGIQAAVNGGASILNLSLGGSTESSILTSVINQAQANGIIVFAAAGNQPVATPTYPAAIPGVIAVAATQAGQLAPYSNYGSFVSIALPGASVVYLGGQAFVVQGTSPATAYAAGIAAGTRSGTSMTWAQILANMQKQFPVPTRQ